MLTDHTEIAYAASKGNNAQSESFPMKLGVYMRTFPWNWSSTYRTFPWSWSSTYRTFPWRWLELSQSSGSLTSTWELSHEAGLEHQLDQQDTNMAWTQATGFSFSSESYSESYGLASWKSPSIPSQKGLQCGPCQQDHWSNIFQCKLVLNAWTTCMYAKAWREKKSTFLSDQTLWTKLLESPSVVEKELFDFHHKNSCQRNNHPNE
jgi:hypothetical protein